MLSLGRTRGHLGVTQQKHESEKDFYEYCQDVKICMSQESILNAQLLSLHYLLGQSGPIHIRCPDAVADHLQERSSSLAYTVPRYCISWQYAVSSTEFSRIITPH